MSLMKTLLALTLTLTGCAALLDDSDYARLEQPDVAYACAAYLMRVDAPGPVPRVVWSDSKWVNTYAVGQQLVEAEYVDDINTVYIKRSYHAVPLIVHEMVHAIQLQIGEEYGENEAKKHQRWVGDCVNFAGL